jgi:hypothetical protein
MQPAFPHVHDRTSHPIARTILTVVALLMIASIAHTMVFSKESCGRSVYENTPLCSD